MKISEINLYQVKLPLKTPYRVSFRTYTEFEPLLVEMRDDDGNSGWGEAYIPAGSTAETAETGWAFCREHAQDLIGRSLDDARVLLDAEAARAPFAVTAMMTALDILARHPALDVTQEVRLPLLVPVSGKVWPEILDEVDRLLEAGYRTLKVKVGWEVDDDLARVALVQRASAGRAEITIDANRGYTREQGCRFASRLDPAGIALFEQPCEADEWEANAAVASVSTVPLMLDESIRSVHDIERAATIDGVRLVKLKLKRVGGIDRALHAMRAAESSGLGICLGDGVATDLLCWVEACIGWPHLTRAGDMNGFLKPRNSLLEEPLAFDKGSIVIHPQFRPRVDANVVKAHQLRCERFARSMQTQAV